MDRVPAVMGVEDEALEMQLLEDDLAAIRSLAGPGPDDLALGDLLMRGLERFQADEAAWQALAAREDAASQSAQNELKRRETVALLISMRARTTVSEMRMDALGRWVSELERQHAERLAESTQLRHAIAALNRRIACLEAALGAAPAEAQEHRHRSWGARLARFLHRRGG
jgi:uncharacterized sporulation protein YeaH/YhbH (DUF444 family)